MDNIGIGEILASVEMSINLIFIFISVFFGIIALLVYFHRRRVFVRCPHCGSFEFRERKI